MVAFVSLSIHLSTRPSINIATYTKLTLNMIDCCIRLTATTSPDYQEMDRWTLPNILTHCYTIDKYWPIHPSETPKSSIKVKQTPYSKSWKHLMICRKMLITGHARLLWGYICNKSLIVRFPFPLLWESTILSEACYNNLESDCPLRPIHPFPKETQH